MGEIPERIRVYRGGPIFNYDTGLVLGAMVFRTVDGSTARFRVDGLKQPASWFRQFAPKATFGWSIEIEQQFAHSPRSLLRE